MKLIMAAIFDAKSESYGRPMFVRAYGEAERAFKDVVNDGKSDYSLHPEDFSLFEVGTFEDASGVVVGLSVPRCLGTAVTFKTTDPAQLQLLRGEA
ncbi:MAG: nonstructural protein [Microvirus sp.]|nr:MAG: nonstructural protein [Microvirus sp.]